MALQPYTAPILTWPKKKKKVRKECWIEIVNESDDVLLVNKHRFLNVASQHIIHPGESRSITHGETWKTSFTVKIHIAGQDLNPGKLLQKLLVDKLYRIHFRKDGFSYKIIQPKDVDPQLVAQRRMEEIWDNMNYYETLRISRKATQREVRIAYLTLAKEYHPDKNPNPNAQLMFEKITEAYHTLSDEEIRYKYDVILDRSTGLLSKSYWRHILCSWNKHKAVQVGFSVLLASVGSAVMLTSLILSTTLVGVPATIAGTTLGGMMFGAGIGGLSEAFSQEAALEHNVSYKKWLKYSAWYGIAGGCMGAITGGMGMVLVPAVGTGLGAYVAAATVQGAITGMCFSVADGMATDRWLEFVKKFRVDSIALDLLMGSLIGATTGAVLESIIGGMSGVLRQLSVSVETVIKGTSTTIQKRMKAPVASFKAGCLAGETPMLLEDELEAKCQENDIQALNEAIDLFDTVSKIVPEKSLVFINNSTKSCKVKMYVQYLIPNEHYQDPLVKTSQSAPFLITESDSSLQHPEPPTFDDSAFDELRSSVSSQLSSEEDLSAGGDLAMIPMEEETADDDSCPDYADSFNDYSYSVLTEPVEVNTSEEVRIVKQTVTRQNIRVTIPHDAKFIQVHFDYKPLGKAWRPVRAWNKSKQTGLNPRTTHVFNYPEPTTRRFILDGFFDKFCVWQIRDEFEQIVVD